MNMQTNLPGRLRNTPLPVTSGLMPLFEAVVNSIHAIEEAGQSTAQGQISIEILRKQKQEQFDLDDSKKKRGPDAREDIVGFKVTDTGIGFTDANIESFHTLDSEHKASKGCRGVGRLLWLKAFKHVRVESIFQGDGGKLKQRSFMFDASGVSQEIIGDAGDSAKRSTTVHLDDFSPKYREYSRKTPQAIADSIFEHCLWYFIREGSAPLITLFDDGESISLSDTFDQHMHSSAITESITLKDRKFELIHVKLRSNSLSAHAIAFCADNRLVMEEKIAGRIPGLHGKVADGSGEFIYSCYVCSDFLDECARPERTGFDIMDSVDGLLAKTEISLSDIRDAVVERAKEHLSEHLAENMKRAKERVETFVAHKAPRYRPILSRIPNEDLNVDPDISDKDLDLALHKQLAAIESQLLDEGHDIMSPKQDENLDEYSQRLAEYLQKAVDIKRSDLANYVSHRRVILDLLEKSIERGDDGKYAREDMIHSLIMPMRKDSSEVFLDSCNLWLVDERLAFHDYLASDKTLASMPITGSKEMKEPDLCALNVFDNPILVSEGTKLPLASIVVVEIKKPMRNDAAPGEIDDPVEQAISYLDRIRKGKVLTSQGRPIPESEHIPGFCYVLADLTPKLQERCLNHHDFNWTPDRLGFFGYKKNCKAFVEVISFNRLVNSAKERNRAFFDKLGLPTT